MTAAMLLIALTCSSCRNYSSVVQSIAGKTGRNPSAVLEVLEKAKPAGQSLDQFASQVDNQLPEPSRVAAGLGLDEGDEEVKNLVVEASCEAAKARSEAEKQRRLSEAIARYFQPEDTEPVANEFEAVPTQEEQALNFSVFVCDLMDIQI